MPLDKGCSTKAMGANIRNLVDKEGKPNKQAVAIAYSVLRKACGLQGKEQMTPKQIVAFGASESLEEKAPDPEMVKRLESVIKSADGTLGAGIAAEYESYDEKKGIVKVLISLTDGHLDGLFDKAIEANPPPPPEGPEDEPDVDEDAVLKTYSELVAADVDNAAMKVADSPPIGRILAVLDAGDVGKLFYTFAVEKTESVVMFGRRV